MGSRRELFGCFLLTSEVSRAVLSPETASENGPLSLFYSSPLFFFLFLHLFWGRGCFSWILKLDFVSGVYVIHFVLFTLWICCR